MQSRSASFFKQAEYQTFGSLTNLQPATDATHLSISHSTTLDKYCLDTYRKILQSSANDLHPESTCVSVSPLQATNPKFAGLHFLQPSDKMDQQSNGSSRLEKRALLKIKGWYDIYLAQNLGVHHYTMNENETGESRPTRATGKATEVKDLKDIKQKNGKWVRDIDDKEREILTTDETVERFIMEV